MNELEMLRIEIDKIDKEIISLYEKRMDVVKKVTEYKIKNNIPVLDSSRESKMLEKNLNLISKDEFKKYYVNVLSGFLKASKEMQNDLINGEKDDQ